MASDRRRVRLHVALLTLVVGLVLLTVALTAWVSAATAARSVEDLQRRYFRATAEAIAARVRAYLEPAVGTLADTRSQVLDDRVSLTDRDDLSRYLVSRIQSLPHLAWLTYSDAATGRFVGAWRDEKGVLLNWSDPAVDGGMPVEHRVEADGHRVPFRRELKGGYDPRTGAWYRKAVAATGVVWTEPFEFNEKKMGITSALAVRAPGAEEPSGVLTADFFLATLGRHLESIAIDESTSIDVLTRAGNVVASAWSQTAAHKGGPAPSHLAPALRSAPTGVATLAPGSAPSWSFDDEGETRIAGMTSATTEGGGDWVVIVSVPEDRFLEGVRGNRRLALALGSGVALLAVGFGWVLARRLTRPLGRISDQLESIARFDLRPVELPASRIREVNVLTQATERMTASLRSFGRYVPAPIVKDLVARGDEARLGGERRTLTIFFSDLENFATISEAMDPAHLVEYLRAYLDTVCKHAQESGATIDKFVGDAVVAFWNAPHDVDRHAERACGAAIEIQKELAAAAERRRGDAMPVVRARIGLHTGTALVGNVGTSDRFSYTAMGDAVNIASRLEAINKRYGTSIVVSDATRRQAGDAFEWRRLERVAVAGRREGVLAVELLGRRGDVPAETLAARDLYESALDAFSARRFEEAAKGFRRALIARPSDRAAAVLRERAEALLREPPPADWTDVEQMTEK